MASDRQVVIFSGGDAGNGSLGRLGDVVYTLSCYNTAPDGSPDGVGLCFGPGMRMELPLVGEKDEVNQLLVTVTDEEFAWPLLARMCKHAGWRLMDPETGRTFG